MPHCSHCKTPYLKGERYCPEDGGAIIEETADREIDPLIGRKVAHRYFVKRQIGKGGMGAVYEAEHVGLDKRVALKFILDKYTEDRDVVLRFHREAQAASRIGHDNIVNITDIDETEDSRHFIAMEYLDGCDLSDELKKAGRLEPARALRIISQVLSGLGAAHAKGIVHRDMKPENVFLTSSSTKGSDFVKIMDFGISKFISAHDSRVRLTETGAVIGTPIYMAPEQAQAADDMDHRVDLYAVGVMLYELLAGRPPFVAPSYLALVTKHLHEAPPPLRSLRPELSVELEQVVHRALEKKPEARYSSTAEFARALPPPNRIYGRAGSEAQNDPNEIARFAPTLPSGQQAAVQPPFSSAMPAQMVALPAPSVQQSYHAPRVSRVPYFMVAGAAVIAIALVVFAVAFTSNDEKATSAAEASEQASTESTSGAGSDDERSAQEDSESPPAGTVRVRSEPAGAEIFINDDSWGKTPLDVELAPGKYVIRLEKTGYATAVRERDVTDKHTLEFDVQLAEASSGQESRVRSSSKRSRRGSRSERRTQTLEGSDGPVVRKQPDRVDPSVEPTRVDPDTKTSAKPKDKSSKTGSKGNPYKND